MTGWLIVYGIGVAITALMCGVATDTREPIREPPASDLVLYSLFWPITWLWMLAFIAKCVWKGV